MNISFWGAMLLMLLVAIVILIFPLLRVRQGQSLAYKTSNIKLHEEKIKELDIDLDEGRIELDEYKIARQELDRELLEDIPEESKETSSQHYTAKARKQPALALAIAVFLPALSLLIYAQLGMHADSEAQQQQQAMDAGNAAPSMDQMVARLESYLKENEGEFKDWVMLARSYKHLRRYAEAANAYKKAGSFETNPQLLLEHAEVLIMMNGQQFNEEAYELSRKALELAPDNVNAVWFAGMAEFQYGQFRKSLDYFTRLTAVAAQDANFAKSLRFYIAEARAKLIEAGEEVASMDELMPAAAPVAKMTSLQVSIDVSDEVRQKFAGNDVVFVYAKALTGPKMPLAAQRLTLADLPASVVLDDSMAMMEGMNISAFKQVVVSARVTKTGAAIAQSGDYIGKVTVNDVTSTADLSISIDSPVP
ncbi:MAG: c-type cytochrome biogenesis protein CcmI [Gammaproteobacteria bacterium]|nr:c-type cytochrome biogenesis protein CcmI [Gammaproteobacteria bacterium]MCW8924483.1 c-type cytochrome biogenesis protein CcmI [Gammaproteobacteria bacterium]